VHEIEKHTRVKPLKMAIIALLSGLAEPVGTLPGTVALSAFGTGTLIGYSLVFAAGVCVRALRKANLVSNLCF
jgi:zinc transporter ZupT